MDANKFESLLWTDEGTTVDFKRDQYKFVKATDDEKSELLKDILGFANAWRQGESFILIGVQEVRGGRAEVVGIPDIEHLADHSLQQFVNCLTNRPINFAYETHVCEGKQVGIIRIPIQRKPFHLKNDYGPLRKGAVYVRRGSATNINKPAEPDELVQMGETYSGRDLATLIVKFADVERENVLGDEIDLETRILKADEKSIPDAKPEMRYRPGYITAPSPSFNKNYYRDFAKYYLFWSAFRLVRIAVQNTSQVAAQDVRVEMTVAKTPEVQIQDCFLAPEPPKKMNDVFGSWSNIEPKGSTVKIKPIDAVGDFIIRDNQDAYILKAEFGLIQSGRTIYSYPFVVGRVDSGPVVFNGQIYSNAPATSFSLTANVRPSYRMGLDVQEIIELASQFKE